MGFELCVGQLAVFDLFPRTGSEDDLFEFAADHAEVDFLFLYECTLTTCALGSISSSFFSLRLQYLGWRQTSVSISRRV